MCIQCQRQARRYFIQGIDGADRIENTVQRREFSFPLREIRLVLSYTSPPQSTIHTYIYIYIFSISSSLHNGSVSPVPFTQWNRLHRTGIYHRILERGSSYKSGALVKFLLASKRRLPFTVPSPHVSLSLASARRRSLFSGPAFHSLPPIRIHLTDFGDRLEGEAIGSSFICPRPRRERRKNKKGKEDLGDLPESGMCIIRDPMKATCEQPFPNFCILLFFFFFTLVRSVSYIGAILQGFRVCENVFL